MNTWHSTASCRASCWQCQREAGGLPKGLGTRSTAQDPAHHLCRTLSRRAALGVPVGSGWAAMGYGVNQAWGWQGSSSALSPAWGRGGAHQVLGCPCRSRGAHGHLSTFTGRSPKSTALLTHVLQPGRMLPPARRQDLMAPGDGLLQAGSRHWHCAGLISPHRAMWHREEPWGRRAQGCMPEPQHRHGNSISLHAIQRQHGLTPPAQPTAPSTQAVQCSALWERRSAAAVHPQPCRTASGHGCTPHQEHEQDLVLQEGHDIAPHTLLLDPATCSLHFPPQNTTSIFLSKDSNSTPHHHTVASQRTPPGSELYMSKSSVRELHPRVI